ncbi:MAG: folate family ECF transporter S component [Erysipelotrichaceae bacterium]|nr:folate family ECF transporter S component [Erysipelotrichaceae bacterium]
MALIVQGICLVAIIVLGVFIFRRYPLKIRIKEMVLTSLFMVIGFVLSYFSLMIPLLGFPSLKIGFAQLPLMLLGALFGPSYGFLAGLIFDLIGLIITPTDFPFLGFTLNNILVCVLPALWFHSHKKRNQKQIVRGVMMVCCVLVAVVLIYLWSYTYSEVFITKYFALTNQTRVGITVAVFVFVGILLIVMSQIMKKYQQDGNEVANWMVCVLCVELILNLVMTPIWLQVMYGIPYMVNFFLRAIKALIMIPTMTVLGFALLRIVRRLYKG